MGGRRSGERRDAEEGLTKGASQAQPPSVSPEARNLRRSENRLFRGPLKALDVPGMRENPDTQRVIAPPGAPEEFAARIKPDGDRYRGIVRAANLRVE